MADNLYGGKGIDTPYERQIFDYHPELEYPIQHSVHQLPPVFVQKIQRAQNFTITQSLMDYDTLSQDVADLMAVIENRQGDDFNRFQEALANDDYEKILEAEDAHCGYDGSGDYEIYDVLYRMKRSVDRRRNFLDRYFRPQVTDQTDAALALEDEQQAIQQWAGGILDGMRMEDELAKLYGSGYEVDNPFVQQQIERLKSQIAQNQLDSANRETLHTTLADVAYIHKNRYTMFQDITGQLRDLVTNPSSVIQTGAKSMIQTLSQMPDLSLVKSHLILSFQSLKQKLNNLKGQILFVDDNKEEAISKQLWFYQQVHAKTTNPLVHFLYNQQEGESPAFDQLATILTGSMQNVLNQYDQSIIDKVKFYQQEAILYGRFVDLLRKKEEIRQFLRIVEDLQDAGQVTEDWIDEYVKAHGYGDY